jgi:hypothetical protein
MQKVAAYLLERRDGMQLTLVAPKLRYFFFRRCNIASQMPIWRQTPAPGCQPRASGGRRQPALRRIGNSLSLLFHPEGTPEVTVSHVRAIDRFWDWVTSQTVQGLSSPRPLSGLWTKRLPTPPSFTPATGPTRCHLLQWQQALALRRSRGGRPNNLPW